MFLKIKNIRLVAANLLHCKEKLMSKKKFLKFKGKVHLLTKGNFCPLFTKYFGFYVTGCKSI